MIGLMYENDCMYIFYVIMMYLRDTKIKENDHNTLRNLLRGGPNINVVSYADIKVRIN